MAIGHPTTTICGKCGITRPIDRFYKNSRICKDCINGRERYMRHNPECPTIFQQKSLRTSKICSMCKREKPLTEYSARQSRCRECASVYLKRYREVNLDRLIAKDRLYRSENIAKEKENHKRYYLTHREDIRAKTKKYFHDNWERIREYRSEYYKNNSHQYKARASRRRALIESVTIGDIGEIERFYEFVREKSKLRCYWCKSFVLKKDRHVDHIIPLSRGGMHSPLNLCCSCRTCNLSKHNKMPNEFSNQAVLAL